MSKPTIYQALKNKLKREPTNIELKNEVKRIIQEAIIEAKQCKRKRK